jgi:2-methylcitrate dehydratase PrpD
VDDSIDEAAADVTAILKDGRREHVFVKHAIGSVDNPLSDAQLEAKFRDMSEPVIGKKKTDMLIAACRKLGESKSASAIGALSKP